MKVGDHIWYWDGVDHWPGSVLDIKKRVKIRINHINGNKTLWVTPARLELQVY